MTIAQREKREKMADRLIYADKLYMCFIDKIFTKKDWAYYEIEEVIKNAPTVDAEPVKHGHWDDMGDFEQCSVCHGTHLKRFQTYYGEATWVKMSYCPNCGAKMDESEEQ